VHRIKVDERNGFFLTTGRLGGLVVRDVESKKVLWELPKVGSFDCFTYLSIHSSIYSSYSHSFALP
jgi:hypothetical protein